MPSWQRGYGGERENIFSFSWEIGGGRKSFRVCFMKVTRPQRIRAGRGGISIRLSSFAASVSYKLSTTTHTRSPQPTTHSWPTFLSILQLPSLFLEYSLTLWTGISLGCLHFEQELSFPPENNTLKRLRGGTGAWGNVCNTAITKLPGLMGSGVFFSFAQGGWWNNKTTSVLWADRNGYLICSHSIESLHYSESACWSFGELLTLEFSCLTDCDVLVNAQRC